MPKYIHVNKFRIRAGEPAIGVRRTKSAKADYSRSVAIKDEQGREVARIVHSDTPLKCGARVWIETDLKVESI